MDCIFCQLASGKIPTDIIYEDKDIFVFKDASPQADIHYLAIPKIHISSMNEMEEGHIILFGKILHRLKLIAKEENFADSGYRIVNNCGKDGGQSVDHIHFHLLAGRSMKWPPG